MTGFTDADGYFGVKIAEAKPKPGTQKRSVSNSISLKFRLDQQYLEKLTQKSKVKEEIYIEKKKLKFNS